MPFEGKSKPYYYNVDLQLSSWEPHWDPESLAEWNAKQTALREEKPEAATPVVTEASSSSAPLLLKAKAKEAPKKVESASTPKAEPPDSSVQVLDDDEEIEEEDFPGLTHTINQTKYLFARSLGKRAFPEDEAVEELIRDAPWHKARKPSYKPAGETLDPTKWKTQICRFFQKGACNKGDACSFAHGVAELEPDRPDSENAASSGIAKEDTSSKDAVTSAAAPIPEDLSTLWHQPQQTTTESPAAEVDVEQLAKQSGENKRDDKKTSRA